MKYVVYGFEMPVASSNLRIRPYSITSLCTFSMFSGLVLVVGRTEIMLNLLLIWFTNAFAFQWL